MDKLMKIAQREDIPIIDMELMGKEEALSHSINGLCIIAIDRKKVRSHADYKVKSAHELGHCVTDSFYDENCPVTTRGRMERRADVWAIRNTVPRKALIKALKNSVTELWELSEHFGITEDFMKKALKYYNLWNGD
ncbi:MAG: ImmA/IrrE family metallo-endopeptidase [Ruminiclostridium sp.]|nr:ImmA/IrrE family metallo-endopeptidase [Ruminiclostridium sp.]